MIYEEFKERLGKLTIPDTNDFLLRGEKTFHIYQKLGVITDGEYIINMSSESMKNFLNIIDILEKRGAVREKDYMVCCNDKLILSIHSVDSFLSDEDFDVEVKRFK